VHVQQDGFESPGKRFIVKELFEDIGVVKGIQGPMGPIGPSITWRKLISANYDSSTSFNSYPMRAPGTARINRIRFRAGRLTRHWTEFSFWRLFCVTLSFGLAGARLLLC